MKIELNNSYKALVQYVARGKLAINVSKHHYLPSLIDCLGQIKKSCTFKTPETGIFWVSKYWVSYKQCYNLTDSFQSSYFHIFHTFEINYSL